jgi:endonuclease/exonuclease/phosphatase family metal-dependent hydrolase
VLLPRAILAAALALLLPSVAPAATPPPAPAEVVFAAWNLRNYVLHPARRADGRPVVAAKSPESVEAVVQQILDIRPDILGVLEIGSRRDLADLQRRLRQGGLDLPHSTRVDGPDKVRRLALLSRYPLKGTRHATRDTFLLDGLPHQPRRGFLDTTVMVRPDFPLRLLGAHLKSRRLMAQFDQAEFRRRESLLLRRRIDDILHNAPGQPLLVFGDFNDTKNSPVLGTLLGRRGSPQALTAVPLADRHGDQWTYRWAETDEYSRIDFVLVNSVLRPLIRRNGTRIHRARDWAVASDHRPLVVTFQLPPSP